jgi:hypothetical protein
MSLSPAWGGGPWAGGAWAGTPQPESGSGTQTLTPALFTNTQTFYAPTVSGGTVTLTPSLATNSQTFYAPTVSATYALTPALVTNSQTFYAPEVTQGAAQIYPALFTNTQIFYGPTLTGGTPVITSAQPKGGWIGRRKRWEPPEPPSAEEVQRERERLGILPAKTRAVAEKVAEREISTAKADGESLRQAYADMESGQMQSRVDRGLRNGLAAKNQKFRSELPQIVETIILDGLSRLRDTDARNRSAELAAMQEEQEVRELLDLWVDM